MGRELWPLDLRPLTADMPPQAPTSGQQVIEATRASHGKVKTRRPRLERTRRPENKYDQKNWSMHCSHIYKDGQEEEAMYHLFGDALGHENLKEHRLFHCILHGCSIVPGL